MTIDFKNHYSYITERDNEYSLAKDVSSDTAFDGTPIDKVMIDQFMHTTMAPFVYNGKTKASGTIDQGKVTDEYNQELQQMINSLIVNNELLKYAGVVGEVRQLIVEPSAQEWTKLNSFGWYKADGQNGTRNLSGRYLRSIKDNSSYDAPTSVGGTHGFRTKTNEKSINVGNKSFTTVGGSSTVGTTKFRYHRSYPMGASSSGAITQQDINRSTSSHGTATDGAKPRGDTEFTLDISKHTHSGVVDIGTITTPPQGTDSETAPVSIAVIYIQKVR